MDKKTIRDIDIKGKRVLMRADFNVPLEQRPGGTGALALKVADDTRIKAALPTINYVLERGAKLVLMSHLGRPKGRVRSELMMDPVAWRLSELLGRAVKKLKDCVGQEVKEAVGKMREGEIILLENLRFRSQEEANEPGFARQLAELGDVYINDAFGTAHRAHASTQGVTEYLPSAAGFLMEREIGYLSKVMENPQRPFVAILGGAKVSDKIAVIENLLKKIDALLIGGGMAYTFLKAQRLSIGSSKLEADKVDVAGDLIRKAKASGVKLVLPLDHLVADKIDAGANKKEVEREIPGGWTGVDIGPETISAFKETLKDAKTILWNGPLGIFEIKAFGRGTREVAQFIAELDAVKVMGGGDTAAAIEALGLSDKMTHVSTGGGATLEFLEGKILPGIAALNDK